MKILHLPVSYLPWTTGGREIYCHTLASSLQSIGIRNEVVIHQAEHIGEPLGTHLHEGIPIHVLPPLPGLIGRRAYYTSLYDDLLGFREALQMIKPDLVHFHDHNGGSSLSHLRVVKAEGIPVMITYHSPGQSCPQRSLLRYGHIPCDGEIRLLRCTTCRLNVSGVPKPLALACSLVEIPGINPWSANPVSRVLSGRQMTRFFKQSFQEFMEQSDGMVALAHWAEKLLLRNGWPREKLHLVQSAGRPTTSYPRRNPSLRHPKLRVVCSGRCDPIKGFHVLVDAVQALPLDAPIEVHLLGPYWSGEYGQHLLNRISQDPRFMAPRLVPNKEMPQTLATMDLSIIPSTWLETGPLTVFDAFAAGLPVIGTDLGGIAERVQHGFNGLLFPREDAKALAECLQYCLDHPEAVKKMQENTTVTRTMDDVALEMKDLYQRVILSA